MKTSIIGAGSWGTALSLLLAENGHDVTMWAMEEQIVTNINKYHKNGVFLPEVRLPKRVTASSEIEDVVKGKDLIVFATPSHTIREMAEKARPFFKGTERVVSVSKGIEMDSFLTMSQVLSDVLSEVLSDDQIAVLSGPSHAEEVSRKMPTTVVSSSNSKQTALYVQKMFMTPKFRVYVNRDIMGVEVSGAVKNILAIAAGIVDGACYGDNAKAALITRGLTEMRRLGIRLGASQDTFSGLTGVGDLIVTCTSVHSRNRNVGYRIGKGEKLKEIISSMNMVAEGVKTTKSVYLWAQSLQVNMPITEKVYQVLFEDMAPSDGVHALMTRDPKEEVIF
ncbi:NAD(P)H-dependent glycerol-3-phosphate dehydrogenase [Balneolaceae bacterium ANBcel3]|nr:NAD(P)H-dependent glycerol-3-phosphate dehydrogenase [Balneolaceae bacterium ANBcel3]